MADKRIYDVNTGLPLNYKRNWGLERVVLDAVSNHLPNDSKGKVTSVKVKQDGKFVDFKLADPTKPVEEVIMEDDGKGYDPKLLSTLLSFKADDLQSVGQFGEGLKGVSTTSLRNNLQVQFRSRNWIADPYSTSEVIEGKSTDMLSFKITENGEQITGSRTVFIKPPKELVKEIYELPNKVLYFNDTYVELHNEKDNVKDPLDKIFGGRGIISNITIDPHFFKKNIFLDDEEPTSDLLSYALPNFKWNLGPKYNSRIIDLKNGKTALYVKNVRVKGISSLYSYDLGIEEIASERNFADEQKVRSEVKNLLEHCANTEVIENVIKTAEEREGHSLLELEVFRPQIQLGSLKQFINPIEDKILQKVSIFDKFITKSAEEDLWVKSFRKLYGEEAVLSSRNSFANGDAETMGYKVIKLDSGLANYLQSKGIQCSDKISITQEYKFVDDLTTEEKELLAECSNMDRYLGIPPEKSIEVKVYSGLFTQTGREIPTSLGVQITDKDGNKSIGIKRECLKNRKTFVKTYKHERGHSVTGAPDEDRAFTDYFVDHLADCYIRDNPK